MINFTDINSAKDAPPKGRRLSWMNLKGYQCAKCKTRYPTIGGSRFVMLGAYRRRVCPACAGVPA